MVNIKKILLPEFKLWNRLQNRRTPLFFEIELTTRCNNNCKHCYINQPINDRSAKEKEITLEIIEKLADEAIGLGALWCLITGGEPLVRSDFKEIYLMLKGKGLLVSLFTNATLINDEHIALFKSFPPRDIEVSVYGASSQTYEKVTRMPGSFEAFQNGLNKLAANNIPVRLKAMALQSNYHEWPEIADFCRRHTKDFYRFDPLLHLRYDRNPDRNKDIQSERLNPQQIVALEKGDKQRSDALKKNCSNLIVPTFEKDICTHLFRCAIGKDSFTISYDGYFRLCSSLLKKDYTTDLRTGALKDAWEKLSNLAAETISDNSAFLDGCRRCTIINLCLWCPANADLEVTRLDVPIKYFCEVAHARAESLRLSLS